MKKNKITAATSIDQSGSNKAMAVQSQDFSSSGILNTDGEETSLQHKRAVPKAEVDKKKAGLKVDKSAMKPGMGHDDVLSQNLDHFHSYDDLVRLIEEYGKKDVQGRTYTHIMSMQQNDDILKLMYQKIETFSNKTKAGSFPGNIQKIINSQDRYGNTPLMLACVHDESSKSGSKYQCVKYLVELGADPNVQNSETGFTALHWASRYGEADIVKLLLENSGRTAIEYIPDFKGYMAVDYAGRFEHFEVVKKLVELTYTRIQNDSQAEFAGITPDQSGSQSLGSSSKKSQDLSEIPSLHMIIQNPMLQSTLLYWASAVPETGGGISAEQLKSMFLGDALQSYPEIPIYVANGKTALHAAAQYGNWNKLQALIEDVKKRQVETATKSVAMMAKKQERFQSKPTETLLKSRQLKQYGINLSNFQKRMDELQGKQTKNCFQRLGSCFTSQDEPSSRWINTQCEDGLTPLHLSCQLNYRHCTEILLIHNGAALDIAADSGLRPRDLIQWPEIKSALQEYFERVDRAIQNVQTADLTDFKQSGRLRVKGNDDTGTSVAKAKSKIAKMQEQSKANEQEKDEECLQSLLWAYRKKSPEDWNFIHRALRCREWLPEIAQMAVKLKIPSNQKKRLNSLITSFMKSDFIVRMFPAVEKANIYRSAIDKCLGKSESVEVYYLLLELSQEDLEKHAEELKYPMKYVNENLKSPYDQAQKREFEPFRSKDIVTIMELLIDENVQRDELEQLMIQRFPVHNLYEINTIETLHSQTSLYETFSQNSVVPTLERREEFNALNALKNYLGERHGFLYAFKNYYTAWLTIPALLGILLTIESLMTGEYISLHSYLFGIFMSLWITMLIEFWKRKQNQFRQLWGTLSDKDAFNQKIRAEFVSNEEFSHINFEVANRDARKLLARFFKLLSRVFMAFLIGLTVAFFLFLKQYDLGIYAGFINAAFTYVTNSAFTTTVVWFNNKENHKHEDSFINSLIQKVFFFKFVNTNITIVWTIYQTDEDADFQGLYSYISGFIVQKLAMLFFWRVIYKYVTFKLKKRSYFKECNKKALEQIGKHKQTMSRLKQSSSYIDKVSQIERLEQQRKEAEIFKHLQEPDQLEYRRLVTVFDPKKERAQKRAHLSSITCIQQDQILIDQVELNSRMNNITMPMEIFDLSEDFILCAFATLYSFICPTIALLIFVSRMFMARFERKAHLNLRVRQPILYQNGLGFWLTILESIGYFTVILNVGFLYIFRNHFAELIGLKFQFVLDLIFQSVTEDKTLVTTPLEDPNLTDHRLTDDIAFFQGDVDTERVLREASPETLKQLLRAALMIVQRQDAIAQFIFIIVVGEHLVIFVKVLIDAFIGDISQRVKNKQIRVESMLEDIDDQLKNKLSDLEIQALNKKIQKQKRTFKRIIDLANERYQEVAEKANDFHEGTIQQIQQEQHMFAGELDQVETGRQSTLKSQSGRRKSTMSQIDSAKSRRSSLATGGQDSEQSQSPTQSKSSIRGGQSPTPNKGALMIPGASPLKLSPMKALPRFIKTKPSLTGFLEEGLQNMQLEYGLEQKLHTQMQIRLFRETFLMIERNLLQKRLVQIGSLSERVIINCAECMQNRAIIQCHDLDGDFFCQKCFSEVAKSYTNLSYSKIGKGQLEQNISTLQDGKKEPKKLKQWQKFEQFYFPFQVSNEQYGQLKLYFTMMKNIYVHMNNINDETMKIDIVKCLIDQNYNILGPQNKKMFLKKFQKEQISTIVGINDWEIETQAADSNAQPDQMNSVKRLKRIQKAESSFNSEELLFLNRVIFYLLTTFGANLQFSRFIETLKLLQDGKFDEKIVLIIEFLKYGRKAQKFIKVDDFVNLIMSSMPQDVYQTKQAVKELQNIFDDGQLFVACDTLKEKLIFSKSPVKDILCCVLQQ